MPIFRWLYNRNNRMPYNELFAETLLEAKGKAKAKGRPRNEAVFGYIHVFVPTRLRRHRRRQLTGSSASRLANAVGSDMATPAAATLSFRLSTRRPATSRLAATATKQLAARRLAPWRGTSRQKRLDALRLAGSSLDRSWLSVAHNQRFTAMRLANSDCTT